MNKKILTLLSLIASLLINCNIQVHAKRIQEDQKEILLTELDNLNITNESTKDLKKLKEIIETKKPKIIYIEQWILLEPDNKKLLKKLHKISKKINSKLFLVVGKNSWFGDRGIANTIDYFNYYNKHIDGIVLRVEPNKINVWKDDISIIAQILNQMLDAYVGISKEVKNRNKIFTAEFPFWYIDFIGPLRPFPEDACVCANRISLLIDKPEKLKELKNWNNVSCLYSINLTKRATGHSEEELNEIYNKLNKELSFYSNFNGFIIDSDSNIGSQLP